MWTCCECENSYDSSTGDVDERMCYDCMYKDEEEEVGGVRKNVPNME